VPIPARSGPSVLLDAGANADSRPEHLLQFGIMGAIFAREILGIASPEVRLLSIGEEPEKGSQLVLEAHALLSAELLGVRNPEVRLLSIGEEDEKGNALTLEAHALLRDADLNFAGNAESRDLLRGAADVLVADGFTGNVALKLLEGTIKDILDALRQEIARTTTGKLGGLLIRPAARRLRTRLDPDTYGGAYLLGLRGLAVIAHGNSGRTAIANAIRLAARGVDNRVVERLAERLPERVRV
jgi:glycerol-3-phosphate acyltransferase PlsX